MNEAEMRFLIVIRKTGSGYSADAPDLPGCVAAGKSIEKTKALMTTAVRMHVELMKRSGERVLKLRAKPRLLPEDIGPQDFCTWVEVPLKQKSRASA